MPYRNGIHILPLYTEVKDLWLYSQETYNIYGEACVCRMVFIKDGDN